MPPCGATRVGEHVRAVGVRAAVVLRPGLALAVGLDDEAAEVGDELVDLVGLRAPPLRDRGVERIVGRAGRRASSARRSWRRDRRGCRRAGACRAMAAAFSRSGARQRLRVRVDAVDDGAVDPDRRVGARVVDARAGRRGRATRTTGRHSRARCCRRDCPSDSAAGARGADARRCRDARAAGPSGSGAGSGTRRRARRPRRVDAITVAAMAADGRRANDVALVAEARERVGPAERRDQRRRRRRADDRRAPADRRAVHARHVDAEQAA